MGQNGSKNTDPMNSAYQYNYPGMINDYYAFQQQAYQAQQQQNFSNQNIQKKTTENKYDKPKPSESVDALNPSRRNMNSPVKKSSSPLSFSQQSIPSSSHPTKSKMFQELLECPICMNTFENPHVLPCQHTFCKGCIISLKKNETNASETISCPICRESHVLSKGMESLTANYTMKRLMELEAMALEKEKTEKLKNKNAKCIVCQKYASLKICNDCSYMLCSNCLNDPNHDILIECKLNLKGRNQLKSNFTKMIKSEPQHADSRQSYHQSERSDNINESQPTYEKLKLVLLCHSSEIESHQAQIKRKNKGGEIFEDEFGKCSTYAKIQVYHSDRLLTLKKIAERKFGILSDDQILVYQDQIMKIDSKRISDFNLSNYDKIHIFDERDQEDNISEINEELGGIYQDFIQSNDTSFNSKTMPNLANQFEDDDEQDEHNLNKYFEDYRRQRDDLGYKKSLLKTQPQRNNIYTKNSNRPPMYATNNAPVYASSSMFEPGKISKRDRYASQSRYKTRNDNDFRNRDRTLDNLFRDQFNINDDF